jgi:hypothetical protein
MWQLIAIVLIAIIWFYLGAIYLTVVAWLNAVGHLLKGNFIRAAVWFSIGVGMLLWWNGTDVIPDPWDFDKWLRGSAVIVGIGALGTFARFYIRHRRAVEVVPPSEPAPVVLNFNIEVSPHADHRAVHDALAALASALRGAIGTEQAPRRISGPTVN